MGMFYRHLLGISLNQVRCEQRGFNVLSPSVKSHLERIGETFVYGYHAALVDSHNELLKQSLSDIEKNFRGFAYEGAGMALALLDLITPWQEDRYGSFIQEAGAEHVYMVHVGAGWAMAKIPWGLSYMKNLDPLLGWLAIDGYGFHQGYFHWQDSIAKQKVPGAIKGYAKQVFDQGLGRSLWFVKGANPPVIASAIRKFPQHRLADLWSGVGLAAAYAGGVDRMTLKTLSDLSASFHAQLAQGVAFAAKARLRADNLVEHTELACQIICGMSAEAAAKITDDTLENLTPQPDQHSYEIWRKNIQQHFNFTGDEL